MTGNILVKVHKAYRDVVAICDEELLGKKFEECGKILEISEYFFGGEKMNENELIRFIYEMNKEDATFNIVGEKSVSLALKAGIITKNGIKRVQGVPFALVLL